MSYQVSGHTYVDGSAVSALVRAYRWDTGAFRAEAQSSETDGSYVVKNIVHGGQLLIVAQFGSGIRPSAHGPIVPEEMPAPPIVWNSEDAHAEISLSAGGYTASIESTVQWRGVRVTESRSSGAWYWEITIGQDQTINEGVCVALTRGSVDLSGDSNRNSLSTDGYLIETGGVCRVDGDYKGSYGVSFGGGDIMRIAWDADAGTVEIALNGGEWQSLPGVTFAPEESLYPTAWLLSDDGSTYSATLAASAEDQIYQPPSGYLPLDS